MTMTRDEGCRARGSLRGRCCVDVVLMGVMRLLDVMLKVVTVVVYDAAVAIYVWCGGMSP